MNIKKICCAVLAAGLVLTTGCNISKTPEKPDYIVPSTNNSRTSDPVGFQFEKPAKGEEIALLETSMGNIKIRLFPESAPIAVTNFKALVKSGYYDGLIFHRVIKDFMVQGGDPQGDGTGGESIWGKGFEYEFNKNLLHFTGALSMAHSSQPNSNGSQFFIVEGGEATKEIFDANGLSEVLPDDIKDLYYEHGGTYHLDGIVNKGGHTVFGQVFEGMDVVHEIAEVETVTNDKPVKDVTIKKASLVKYEG